MNSAGLLLLAGGAGLQRGGSLDILYSMLDVTLLAVRGSMLTPAVYFQCKLQAFLTVGS